MSFFKGRSLIRGRRQANAGRGGSLLTHEVDFISKRFHPRLLGFHPSLTDFIAFAFCLRALPHRFAEPPPGGSLYNKKTPLILSLRALLHRFAEPPPGGSLKLHLAVTSFAKHIIAKHINKCRCKL